MSSAFFIFLAFLAFFGILAFLSAFFSVVGAAAGAAVGAAAGAAGACANATPVSESKATAISNFFMLSLLSDVHRFYLKRVRPSRRIDSTQFIRLTDKKVRT